MCKTKVVHGAGSAALVGEEAARQGIKRALLVTDAGVGKAGLLEGVEASLAARGISWQVFDQVEEEDEVETLHKGTLRARSALRRLKELYLDLGFPRKFDQKEFSAQDIPQMVQTALGTWFIQDNIRKPTAKDLAQLYESSLRGWEMD